MSTSQAINLFVFARFQALLFLLVGVVLGVLYSLGGLINDLTSTGLNMGTALAFMAVIGMPVACWLVGFVLGLIEALLYNSYVTQFNGFNISIR